MERLLGLTFYIKNTNKHEIFYYACPPNLETNEKSKIWQNLTSWNQTKQKTVLTSQNWFLKEITKKAPNRGPHITISTRNGRNESQTTWFNSNQFAIRKSY